LFVCGERDLWLDPRFVDVYKVGECAMMR